MNKKLINSIAGMILLAFAGTVNVLLMVVGINTIGFWLNTFAFVLCALAFALQWREALKIAESIEKDNADMWETQAIAAKSVAIVLKIMRQLSCINDTEEDKPEGDGNVKATSQN